MKVKKVICNKVRECKYVCRHKVEHKKGMQCGVCKFDGKCIPAEPKPKRNKVCYGWVGCWTDYETLVKDPK